MKIKNVTGSSVILRKAVPDETMLFGRGVTIEAGQEIITYDCYAQLSPDLQEFISLGRIQVTGPDQPPYAPPTGGGPASEIATSGLPVVIDPTPPTASQVLKATSPTTAAWGTDAGGVTGSGTNMVVPKWDPTGIGIINSNSGSSTFIAAGFGSPAPTTTMNGGFGTGGSSGGWAYVNGGGSTGSFPGGVQISTGPTSVAGKTPGIISVDGGPSVVGPSISISAGNGRTGVGNGGDVSLTPGSGVSDGKIIINGAVLIPTTTPPTIGQVLSASAIDGTLQWANAGPSGSGTDNIVPKWNAAGTGLEDSGQSGSGDTYLYGPDGASPGSLTLEAGDNTVSGSGGQVSIKSGAATSGNLSGDVRIETAAGSGSGSSGHLYVVSGNTVSGSAGQVSIRGGDSSAGLGGIVLIAPGIGATVPQNGRVEIRGRVEIPTPSGGANVGQVLSAADIAGALQWTTPIKKYAVNVPSGSATVDIGHSLGTQDASVTVYTVAAPYDQVFPDVQFKDTNTVTLIFSTAPGTNEFRCVVIG